MKFAEPLWLLAGAIACGILIWTWLRYDARQRAALASFASSHLHSQLTASFSTLRRNWQRGLFAASVALLFVALARPQAGYRWEEVKRKGVEILFAVDTSKSMLTPDAKPDRLTRAKLAIDDFVGHLDGDGVGLVAFAGNAFLQCPITLDYDAFNESLDALDTNTIPRGGTDIASAIHEAQTALQNRPAADKILILLTDGEDLEDNAVAAAKDAAQSGLKIYTVGVGTSNGDLIPVPAENGGGFVKDASGQYVKSHLDEAALKSIAEATGGAYAPLGAQGQGLDQIYQSSIAPLTKHDLASRQQKVYIERFQWPLGAALTLLAASLMIGTRRNVKRSKASLVPPVPLMPKRRMAQTAVAAALALAFVLAPASQAHASLTGTAEAAYKKGDYANAQKDYTAAAQKQPDKNVLQFNAGAAAYKAGQYSQAAEDFQKALGAQQQSADPAQLAAQQDAYYNLGNTLYRTGQKTEKEKADETIKTWEQAIKSYDAALQLRKDDADAKYNRDFVQKKLDELKKQQQQQQNQDQKNQQNQKDQKQDQKNQSGQGSDDKNQDNKDQSKNDQNQQGKSGQNSNDKNVAKNDQQKQPGQQDQSKDGQDKKDQANNQGQGQQNPQKDAGQQPDKNQTAQNQGNQQDQNSGTKPDQQQGQQANNGSQGQQPQGSQPKDQQPNGNGSQVAQNGQDQQRAPGEMSKQEARQLLDSLKDEQKALPGTPLARSGATNNQNDQPLKDW